MGTYVSGTPVRGGDRTPYFTKRSQMASFRRDEGRRLKRTKRWFIIDDIFSSWIYKCTLQKKNKKQQKELFRAWIVISAARVDVSALEL